MPNHVDANGRLLPNTNYKKVAASQTTAQISSSGDAVVGTDFVSHIIVTAASSAAPGAVTLFDGTTSILVHTAPSAVGQLVWTYDVGAVAESTIGFNVTTGTSVSVVVVGRFSG